MDACPTKPTLSDFLDCATASRTVGSFIDIAVARADSDVRPVDGHFDLSSFAGSVSFFRVVPKGVLAAQLFGDVTKGKSEVV